MEAVPILCSTSLTLSKNRLIKSVDKIETLKYDNRGQSRY
jgi:hypothetical protein